MHASGSEWVDPEDPTVIAETELLGAAASIEAAAKKLEQLKPRAKPKVRDCMTDHLVGLCPCTALYEIRCTLSFEVMTIKVYMNR